ncbi:N-acetylmuramoyl-L-alanine amidase [Actinoplanes sp. NPDC026619]|uniref:N-acetylmuramoyl-L-alanine amidase n=1 Tax=Actinoplanes sp. NPDC026619 TaxID=3155798 RepID=UPI0033C553DD
MSRRATADVPLPTRPVPRMVTRAGWHANEAIVRAAPTYTGPVGVFFVHHTATGNGYSCADSAAIVRGIQAYQVRTKGWDDIGYNFLVDKCGRIFEGRGGGVNRSVLGAHTMGFNSNASAIAVIGTFDGVGVSPTVRTAIATVAAYKLGAAGNPPDGKVVITSGGGPRYAAGARATLWRISGHRDAGRTACPGDSLYRQLPAIRAIAGAATAGLRYLRMPGASRYGTTLYTKGLIRPLWNVTTPSALINRFEMYVDGNLEVATPGTHRTTALRLAPGDHVVTIKAEHLSGKVKMVGAKVVSDAVAPEFVSGPTLALRTGSLDGSVPIQLQWTADDANGVAAVAMTSPSTINLGTVVHSRNGTLAPGRSATFALRAADRAGNTVDGSVTRTPVVVSEAAAQRTGTWRTLSNPGYLGGVALGATAAGSSATWHFSGSSAAIAVSRAAQSGRMRVIVDGDDLGVIDLGSPKTVYRQAIWSRSWPTSGDHTVRVEVEGTPGRPGVVLDGLVYLR